MARQLHLRHLMYSTTTQHDNPAFVQRPDGGAMRPKNMGSIIHTAMVL